MPVDPNISLAASATGGTAAGNALTSGNPLDTISKFAGIQNALNQNKLFQQTFAARQKAGSIIAGAPDLESGLASLYQDPLTAAFAGEITNNIRQAQLTGVNIAKERQDMAQGALANSIKLLTGVMADPSQFESLVAAGRAVTDPTVHPELDSGMASIATALSHGLPQGTDPASTAARMKLIQARAGGLLMGTGITPEVIQTFTGKPEMPNVGGEIVPGITGGILGPAPGAFVPAGRALATSPNPRVDLAEVGPGGAKVPVQLGGAAGAGGVGAPVGPGGNALGGTVPAPASGAAPAVAGPGMTQRTYLESRGKDMADYQKALDERVAVGTTIMQTVNEAKDALSQVRAGGGGTAYTRLAQLAQAFGAGNELVDKIAQGSLPASQEFSKLMVNTTMGQIREQLQGIGGSRLSQMEFKSFQENNPNLDTDPRAIDKIFNFWTRLYNRDSLEQGELNQHLDSGKALSSWPATWQKIMRDRGIVGTSTGAAGSQREGPVGAATHRWVPGQGIVPIGP